MTRHIAPIALSLLSVLSLASSPAYADSTLQVTVLGPGSVSGRVSIEVLLTLDLSGTCLATPYPYTCWESRQAAVYVSPCVPWIGCSSNNRTVLGPSIDESFVAEPLLLEVDASATYAFDCDWFVDRYTDGAFGCDDLVCGVSGSTPQVTLSPTVANAHSSWSLVKALY